MIIVVWDTETTGLLSHMAAGVEYQPHIVELVAIKLNGNFQEIDRLNIRCKPGIEIPEEAIKVHNITNEDVANCKSFAAYFNEIANFFLGSNIMVGHNSLYDKMVLYYELVRLGKTISFPWSIRTVDTAEVTHQYLGHRLNLTDLHIHLFGEGFTGAHSASADCDVTCKCFVEMVKREMIVL